MVRPQCDTPLVLLCFVGVRSPKPHTPRHADGTVKKPSMSMAAPTWFRAVVQAH